MDSIISRYRNASILAAVLFVQILALAVQIKRPVDGGRPGAGDNRLIRIWAVELITPAEKAIAAAGRFFRNGWDNYIDLRGVRAENAELKNQIEAMRVQQVRLDQDAAQARRLQSLLAFKEQYVNQTVAAQVIGTSGSEHAHMVYIDKGSGDGIKRDMAVITPDGIVGKVKEVFPGSSQVLLINDMNSGAGAILENSRLQGTVKGSESGQLMLDHIMVDESVQAGERVLTSGGDQIFPKGFPIGTVAQVSPGQDVFLNVRVKPSANLSRLEEVLVITQMQERAPVVTAGDEAVRAADVLANRLPTLKPPAPEDTKQVGKKVGSGANAATPATPVATKPPGTAAEIQRNASPELKQAAPKTKAATAAPATTATEGGKPE